MKVLITGITGFAGGHLAALLSKDEGLEIHGTYHSSGSEKKLSEFKDLSLHQVDLSVKEQVNSLIDALVPDQVYHLAAQSSPSESFKNPENTLSLNTLSQLYLLEALKRQINRPRIVTVTSSEVYGKVEFSELPVNELTPHKPISPYAVSKIAQDYLSLYFYLAHKMNIIRVRPFNHTGPGQEKFVIPAFAKQIVQIEKSGEDPVMKVGNLAAKKDFSDVRDIVRAYKLLMEEGVAGEVYNVGSGKSVQIKWILDTLLSFSNKKIQVEVDQSLFRPIDIEDIYVDHTKLTNETGWQPEIPLEQTLKDVLDYFRKVI